MNNNGFAPQLVSLDPTILFFDEPSAGLDPISARRLDELIIDLRDSLGITAVVVSHDLASIFTIGDNSVYLDAAQEADDLARKAMPSGHSRAGEMIGAPFGVTPA